MHSYDDIILVGIIKKIIPWGYVSSVQPIAIFKHNVHVILSQM